MVPRELPVGQSHGGGAPAPLTLKEASERYNISLACLKSRVYNLGLTIEEAVEVPVQSGRRKRLSGGPR
jgi:hypothetical protein